MVLVVVRVDDILDRLVRDALHFSHNLIVVLLEFVIDQKHAFVRHQNRNIPAVPDDLVEIILDFIHR